MASAPRIPSLTWSSRCWSRSSPCPRCSYPPGARSRSIRSWRFVTSERRSIVSRWSLIGNDLRYAIRMLAKQPAFTLVAVLTLAFGIGANSAIFSLVLHALIRPLPFPEPQRVVMVWNKYDALSLPRTGLSGPDVREIHDGMSSFQSMSAFSVGDMSLTGGEQPARVIAARTNASLGDVLGVAPQVGRWFFESEDVPGSNVAVLSDGVWRRRFGG